MEKNKVLIEIDNCCKCPHHYIEQLLSPDSFECDLGCFCSLVNDSKSRNGKHKLVVADEDVKSWAYIPDWCPLLIMTHMRDTTPEEQQKIDEYLKSISTPTGINVFDIV